MGNCEILRQSVQSLVFGREIVLLRLSGGRAMIFISILRVYPALKILLLLESLVQILIAP
jgi:hypothetical protein